MRLRASSSETIRVGANAISDTLVVLPIPTHVTYRILSALKNMVKPQELPNNYANAFWSKEKSDENSIIVFPSEYKKNDGVRNKNHLVMDFGAAQSQRRALGLDPAIIWGSTCAMGRFEVFSSEWDDEVRFCPLMNVAWLTASQYISYSSHCQWNLLEPVDFMKCYSFLCNLAGTTATLQQTLEGKDGQTMAQSVVAASWRALTPPTSAGLNKRKRPDNELHGGADGPPVGGKNSEGVDDLEPDESSEWHKSFKNWQLECRRSDVEPSEYGLPLTKHFVKLQPTLAYDGEHGLRSVIDEWSARTL